MRLLFIYTHKGYNDSFLKKDVGMVPSFLSEGKDVEALFYTESKDGKVNFRNLRVLFTGKNWLVSNFYSIIFLFKNRFYSKECDLLVFHLSIRNIIPIIFYKLLFNGKLICKMDLNTVSAQSYCDASMVSITKRIFMKFMVLLTDRFYIETARNYNIVKKGIFGTDISKKIELLPNGVDEELVMSVASNDEFVQREKIITIITRFDSEDKAPYRVFDVVQVMADLNLKDWRFNIIGNFPDSFITELMNQAGQLGVNVTCLGKNQTLNEVYNKLYKSSIFLCLSKEESYCISLVEAAVFNNYIITTNVGVAEDLSKQYDKLRIIDVYTKEELKKSIEKACHKHKSENNGISNEMLKFYSWGQIINRVLRK